MISEALIKSQTARITFVMVDASYTEVAGLLGTTTIAISKNGGPLVPSTGTKGEIGSGWYYYDLTAVETDTVGPLSVKLTHAGCIQQNLEYVVEQRNGGACPYTYTVLHSVTGLPISGVEVWFHTNITLTNVVWYGVTDAFGVARDSYGTLPSLDPGTYYLKRHKPAYSFPAYDTEVVSCSVVVVADDSGAFDLDGAYNNCTLGGSVNRAYMNGVNSYVDYYSAGLVTNYHGDETTIILRAKGDNPSIWTDGQSHMLFAMQPFDPVGGGTGDIYIYKDIVNNQIMFYFALDSGAFYMHTAPFSSLSWFSAGMTFSQVGNEMKAYLDGIQTGFTETPLTAWNGSYPAPLSSYFGLSTIGSPNSWYGWMADGILGWGTVASPAQMFSIHTKLNAGTLTTTDLNTIFGAGNYCWWKLDESP